MPTVTPATLKRAATNFAAWWTEAGWMWTVCPRLLPDSVATVIWTRALLRLSPARYPLRVVIVDNFGRVRTEFVMQFINDSAEEVSANVSDGDMTTTALQSTSLSNLIPFKATLILISAVGILANGLVFVGLGLAGRSKMNASSAHIANHATFEQLLAFPAAFKLRYFPGQQARAFSILAQEESHVRRCNRNQFCKTKTYSGPRPQTTDLETSTQWRDHKWTQPNKTVHILTSRQTRRRNIFDSKWQSFSHLYGLIVKHTVWDLKRCRAYSTTEW